MAGELDVSDLRSRLVDVPVDDSAINWCLIDVSFERVDEVRRSKWSCSLVEWWDEASNL